MPKCTSFSTTIPNTNHTIKPDQKVTLHYFADGKVLCEVQHNLSAGTRFVELPIPVLHRLTMGC